MSKLKEKPSALKREYPALQYMKFINFALLDPDLDPLPGLNQAGSNPDPGPDPKHWAKQKL
jgi:hypothetical protein